MIDILRLFFFYFLFYLCRLLQLDARYKKKIIYLIML